MAKRSEVYKCNICGNIVEVLYGANGQLVCCGEPMDLMEERSEEEGKTEKHKPLIEGNIVRIGTVEHPMTEEHYIEWIEAKGEDGRICKKFLNPGELPEMKFDFEVKSARAYCNLHNLWTN